ncbi:uncharacterized protein B0P05DRAFT_521045 [Gilbertella persicaria]|uniref:uncharacterized protein n=1 Tax=Gilbertella persicaria TaxID=101096 RepID=UPI00221F1835|nr:uncharacterized protein B0P05DRAFT_521045 [Gilbertella persicaria]KAI8098243.1 hypothetical protein B0P05DRAFT_521045 [Gilbertella persicaria]
MLSYFYFYFILVQWVDHPFFIYLFFALKRNSNVSRVNFNLTKGSMNMTVIDVVLFYFFFCVSQDDNNDNDVDMDLLLICSACLIQQRSRYKFLN